ncbi:unnamed protein product [Sphagnum jensenii]|uniref:LIM zinc-binding domain-containing protein n=1 Tax=Sphagnum jensenii TaxID=128206 RepID=A0ABP0WCV1_9BRYO
MKWFDKLFGSSGSSHDYDGEGYYHDYPFYNSGGWHEPDFLSEGPAYSSDMQSAEELDHAIALSLVEDHGRDKPSPEVDDEQLARALQESLNLESGPRFGNPFLFPHFPVPVVPRSNCAGCDKPLGYGRFLSCLGKNWHPECFSCCLCNKPISDREFSVQGRDAYHRDCYKELFHPKCEVCHNFIPTNAAGLIEYRSHPFWNQKYCPRHEQDGTPRCGSCDRIEPADVQYAQLGDGRNLCLECLDTAVLDTKACQPLYREILNFYKTLGMRIDQEIPMLLVERSALNAAREGEKDGHAHTSETRGLCLSEEQTIATVFGRKPRMPIGPANFFTEPLKLIRHCEVTAILVLFGLTRLLTGSILAHELMHAWLRLDGGFPNLPNDVEEGICQVMSHIWLSGELKNLASKNSGSSSASKANPTHNGIQARLGEFYLHQIMTDSSPIYGDGFRRGYAAVTQFGLSRTIEHLRFTGDFP